MKRISLYSYALPFLRVGQYRCYCDKSKRQLICHDIENLYIRYHHRTFEYKHGNFSLYVDVAHKSKHQCYQTLNTFYFLYALKTSGWHSTKRAIGNSGNGNWKQKMENRNDLNLMQMNLKVKPLTTF